MGSEKITLRAVIDTNVLVSALLLSREKWAWLIHAWKSNRIIPIISRPTPLEILRVLSYPKFQLEPTEKEALVADFLPFAETLKDPASKVPLTPCRDPEDDKYIILAVAAGADYLVTGDKDLLDYTGGGLTIITPLQLRTILEA